MKIVKEISMVIYLVQVNGKVSSEAYATLEEAQAFVKDRVWLDTVPKEYGEFYKDLKDLSGKSSYTIISVRVKE